MVTGSMLWRELPPLQSPFLSCPSQGCFLSSFQVLREDSWSPWPRILTASRTLLGNLSPNSPHLRGQRFALWTLRLAPSRCSAPRTVQEACQPPLVPWEVAGSAGLSGPSLPLPAVAGFRCRWQSFSADPSPVPLTRLPGPFQMLQIGVLVLLPPKAAAQPVFLLRFGAVALPWAARSSGPVRPLAFSPRAPWGLQPGLSRALASPPPTRKPPSRASPAPPADLTLDPGTAHRRLLVSADRRGVRLAPPGTPAPPDGPERFDQLPAVLGAQGFGAGRHCWEVETASCRDAPGEDAEDAQSHYAVGAAGESVPRKGCVRLCPAEAIWALEGRGGRLWALTAPEPTLLGGAGPEPRCIRVDLDCERGRVAFYDGRSLDLLFAFQAPGPLGQRIFPLLCTCDPRTPLRLVPGEG
ncbi:RING finger protein 39 isoform X1 [Heterocephalus glaber]|uniref:RING finger protein 39 isoform X1 n=1 Tax=Heterocephalus glaber TaxID=10181 RepID=A0AAX6T3A9_HETGA|nr:RING finger protein 39 isoform X1 [Heterocephalus glaber]XP_021115842.1 RING finger protein 39 isoform X1 [Heterocephalus glaber]